MQQWVVEFALENSSGAKVLTESFYMPTAQDVRDEISKRGGYVLTIRPHKRPVIERWLARSSWWQVQLLRGIHFRSNTTSPSVAFWRLIQAETDARRQNILSPAREALSRGLSVIEALKALQIFDRGTLAILAASDRSNKLQDGILQAIQNITQKKKNRRAVFATMSWIGFDIFAIVQGMLWGKGRIIGWFKENVPQDPIKAAEYLQVVGKLEILWAVLTWIAISLAVFLVWVIFSYWRNRGKKDWLTARIVRRIPLIGKYMMDLSFADSGSAAARMLKGNVNIADVVHQAGEASDVPEVSAYWKSSGEALSRGVNLGTALDREPLTKGERMELAGISDLEQVAIVMESISEMREQAAKTKHSLIVWSAFALSGIFLVIAFGSAIYALTVMNMSMDSMMSEFMIG